MAQFATYDPNDVILSIGGADITGFAPGSFISLVMDSDAFNVVVGVGGDVVRSKSNVRTATLTCTLLQTSPSNDILSEIYNADDKAGNGAGVFAVGLRDSATGRAVYIGANAWIQKAPDVTFDAQDSSRAWTIRIARLERFDGGR